MNIQKVYLSDSNILNRECNTESILYKKGNILYKIIKKEYLDEKRIHTINQLMNIYNNNLVLPLYKVYINDKNNIDGYAMKYYYYDNLSKYIRNISYEKKKELILSIDKIFKNFEEIGYYYFDIHSDNILIKNNDIKVIDADSGFFYDKYKNNSIIACRLAYLYYEILLGMNSIYKIEESKRKRIIGRANNNQRFFLEKAFRRNDYEYFNPLDFIEYFDEDSLEDTRKILGKKVDFV